MESASEGSEVVISFKKSFDYGRFDAKLGLHAVGACCCRQAVHCEAFAFAVDPCYVAEIEAPGKLAEIGVIGQDIEFSAEAVTLMAGRQTYGVEVDAVDGRRGVEGRRVLVYCVERVGLGAQGRIFDI